MLLVSANHLFELATYAEGPGGIEIGPEEIITLGVSFLLWVATYFFIAREAYKTKTPGIPMTAIAVMFSFELCFVLFWPPEQLSGRIMEYVYLAGDIVLVYQAYKYTDPTQLSDWVGRRPLLFITGVMIFAGWFWVTMIPYFELQDGFIPAYAAIAYVSPAFLVFGLMRTILGFGCVSYVAAWTRSLADLCNALFVWICIPWSSVFGPEGATYTPDVFANNEFTTFLLVFLLSFDLFLLILLTVARQRQKEGLVPLEIMPQLRAALRLLLLAKDAPPAVKSSAVSEES